MTVKTVSTIIGGLVLLGLAAWQFNIASGFRNENTALTQEISEIKVAKLNTDREGCAERTQRYFKSLGYSENETKDNMYTTFQNHYSQRLGRCLMLIQTSSFTGGHQVTTESLIDADEHRNFGDYGWVSSDTKKYFEQKPMQCTMSPPDKVEGRCLSTDEWNAYTKEMLSS